HSSCTSCHPHSPPPPLFFFNAPAPTHPSTLSLHYALPIFTPIPTRIRPLCGWATTSNWCGANRCAGSSATATTSPSHLSQARLRSEEHTSELQSRVDLVCRLLLEKKKKRNKTSQQCIRHYS